MLFSYLKIALRNIKKQKFYAAINILGLAIGLGAEPFDEAEKGAGLGSEVQHRKAKRQLDAESTPYADVPIGMMLEVPAAAIAIADAATRAARFISPPVCSRP